LVLHHLRLDTQLRCNRFCKIIFKAGELLWLVRIRKNVRSAALGIRAPEQHASRFYFLKVISGEGGRCPARKQENKNYFTNNQALQTPRVIHWCAQLHGLKIKQKIFF
jgi:hypothetical protein